MGVALRVGAGAGLRKVFAALVVVLLALLVPAACQPPVPTTPPVTTPPLVEPEPLDLLAALQVLLDEVIPPASSDSRVAAYMASEPLRAGDTVTSEDGSQYPVAGDTWFAFVDDVPQAFFAHACRYVFIDAADGAVQVISESWPPDINGASMWNQPASGWHVVDVLSIHDIPLPLSAFVSNAPRGDYGDAPDGSQAYAGVAGQFPTRYATSNGYQRLPGCHTLQTGGETLGFAVTAEVDAMDPGDPDGVPNLVDADSDERAYVILDGLQCRLAFTVSVAVAAPDLPRYLNVLIDFDQSGNWGAGSSGPEWPVADLKLDVAPGSSTTVITPPFTWGAGSVRMSPVWMRALLSREAIDRARIDSAAGWDGSGEFQYGEVEDYFVFLMENPPAPTEVRWPPEPGLPPGGGGGGGGGGAPPAPGPAKGPCGYDVKYHVLVINCGDNSRDLARGTPIVGASCGAVSDAADDQGYSQSGSLSPGGAGDSKTSLANIGKAFDDLKANVKCGDHVLVYICGHGREDGGIAIKGPSGQTQEVMRPTDNGAKNDGKDNSLKDFLNKIPACPDEDCEKPGCCCHVTVVIESCFAGSFNVDGVTGEGRAVVGTSTNTEAWATYPGGGVYTRGLVDGMRNEDTDTDDPPDGVDPMEAHENGEESVSENNKARGKAQQPWESSNQCECKCPCEPDIDVDKWVWNDGTGRWVNQVEAEPGDVVRFRVEIENTGECRDLVDLEIVDSMAGCLEYAGEAVLDFDGDEDERGPDRIWQTGGGSLLMWNLSDMPPLSPGETIGIEYDAEVLEPGPNLNKATASGHCSVDYSVVVSSADLAGVMVSGEEGPPPSPEDILEVQFEVEAESQLGPGGCTSTVVMHLSARDLSGGEYPVTGVALEVNGLPWYNSGPVLTTFYGKTLQLEADCGQPFDFVLTAVNSDDMHATTAGHIVTPLP